MTTRSMQFVLPLAMLIAAAAVSAQAPKNPAPGAAPAVPAKKVDLPTPPPNFEYSAEGRRDPFVSLVNRGKTGQDASAATAKRADGVPGMLTSELTVRGIVQTRGVWVAMISGPDNKVYTVRAGDKLADGVVRMVNATTVVILQEVNDPLSLQKQREVRKFLRGGEEVK